MRLNKRSASQAVNRFLCMSVCHRWLYNVESVALVRGSGQRSSTVGRVSGNDSNLYTVWLSGGCLDSSMTPYRGDQASACSALVSRAAPCTVSDVNTVTRRYWPLGPVHMCMLQSVLVTVWLRDRSFVSCFNCSAPTSDIYVENQNIYLQCHNTYS